MIDKELYLELDDYLQYLVACEALLRRTSIVHLPFALKGSLLTRQYMPNEISMTRHIKDLDFFYMKKIEEMHEAGKIFTDWMTKSTSLYIYDSIIFEEFKNRSAWDSINYAMDEDFPTVNTVIDYMIPSIWGENEYYAVDLDVSFNIPNDFEFAPLVYKPILGDEFFVPYTVPLYAQIAWKLHQTIIRPRYKDLYDLKFLISHSSYKREHAEKTLKVLADECRFDKSLKEEQKSINFTENRERILNGISKDRFWANSEWNLVTEEMALQCLDELVDVMENAELTNQNFKQYL